MPEEAMMLVDNEQAILEALVNGERADLMLKLSAREKEDLEYRITTDFQDASGSNQVFRKDRVEFYKNWRMVPELKDDGAVGEKSANVKVPFTSTIIEQWKSRLIKALLGGDKIAKFYSLDNTTQEDLDEVTEWFQWELENVVRLEDHLDDILHYTLLDGICLPIAEYVVEEGLCWSIEEFEFDPTVDPSRQLDSALGVIFEEDGVEEIYTTEPARFTVRTSRHPNTDAKVNFLIEDGTLIAEVQKVETTFDGVKIRVPNIEDVVVANTDACVDNIPFFGLRSWMLIEEFEEKAGKGKFFDLVDGTNLDSILASGEADKVGQHIPQEITEEQDHTEGTDSKGHTMSATPDDSRRWIEIYRWEGWVNVKGQGRVGVVAWQAAKDETLLRVRRLSELNKDGGRTPVKFEFISSPGRFYGVGLAELVQHVQTELDGIHNYRLDCGQVAATPGGFFEPVAGLDRNAFTSEPGKWYPVKSVDKIKHNEFKWSPVWGFQEEALVRRYGNELAGMGDMSAGTFVSKRVSAAEFMGTSEGIDARTERIVRRFVSYLEQLLYRIFGPDRACCW